MQLRAGLRKLVKQGLLAFGYPTARLRETDAALVLFYHAIGGDYGVPEREFEQQLHYLNAHFDLIFASEVGKPSPSGRLRVAITFDDGLKNTRDVALPLLRKHGIKATIYVLPGELRWLWPAEIRERLLQAMEAGVTVDGLVLRDEADVYRVVQDIKNMPDDESQTVLETIRAQTPFEPSESWRASQELMTADELRALPDDLIELGAHTVSHPILPRLDDDRLRQEIVDVRERLETLLERPIRTFTFPNGDFDRRCLDLAASVYDFAFTTETALSAYPDPIDARRRRHAINRLHGVSRHADMPLAMQRFIKQGYGFASVDEPSDGGDHLAVVPPSSRWYEMLTILHKLRRFCMPRP